MNIMQRLARGPRDPLIFDFTRYDLLLPGPVTFARPDPNQTATRRRINGAVGPSRTNSILQSSDLSSVAGSWIRNGAPTVTGNFAIAPDGTGTAARFQGSGAGSGVFQNVTVTAGVTVTDSVYLKDNGGTDKTVKLGVGAGSFGGIGGDRNLTFNTATQAFTAVDAVFLNVRATAAANGFWRVQFTHTPTSTAATGAVIVYGNSANADFLPWGYQHETGFTATPYIATAAAAVTTNAWPRTNLIFTDNVEPRDLSGVVLSGDPAAVLSLVDDSQALNYAGLRGMCGLGKVYKLDNTAGVSLASVNCIGGVVSLGPHSGSMYVRGTGNAEIRINGAVGQTPLTANYVRRKLENQIPANTARALYISLAPGAVAYFILQQLEEGPACTSVLTTRGQPNVSVAPSYGDTQMLLANFPRLDSTLDGTPRGLMVEPAATQRLLNPSNLLAIGAGWNLNGSTVQATMVSGRAAFKVTENSAAAVQHMLQTSGLNMTLGEVNTFWVIAKAAERSTINLTFDYTGGGGGYRGVAFNLLTGACQATNPIVVAAPIPAGSFGSVPLEDGFYLCWVTDTAFQGGSMVNSIKLRSVYSNGNDEAYNGDGASGVYVAAAQLVQSAALTSLVLAAGATTTRASDYCAIENLSDVAWNAAAWSGYVEWENNARVTPAGLFPTVTALRDAPGTNFLQFYLQPTTNTLFVKIVAANVVLYEASGGLPVLAAGAVHRLAYSVTPNGVLVSVNGGAPILYAVAIPTATLAQLVLGNISSNNAGNALGGWIRKAKAWGRALSGLELQVESA